MDMSEYSNAVRYCAMRCSQQHCSSCKTAKAQCCRAGFIIELYDIIDIKTLERNNINNILDDLDILFDSKKDIKNEALISEISRSNYNILVMFIDDQYKMTKRKEYKEKIRSVIKLDE